MPSIEELRMILGFSTAEEVKKFLRSPMVLTPFHEVGTYLLHDPSEPTFDEILQSHAANIDEPGFGSATAIKIGWTASDHFANYIMRVTSQILFGDLKWPALGVSPIGWAIYNILLCLCAIWKQPTYRRSFETDLTCTSLFKLLSKRDAC